MVLQNPPIFYTHPVFIVERRVPKEFFESYLGYFWKETAKLLVKNLNLHSFSVRFVGHQLQIIRSFQLSFAEESLTIPVPQQLNTYGGEMSYY
jgi:hypothetical protein